MLATGPVAAADDVVAADAAWAGRQVGRWRVPRRRRRPASGAAACSTRIRIYAWWSFGVTTLSDQTPTIASRCQDQHRSPRTPLLKASIMKLLPVASACRGNNFMINRAGWGAGWRAAGAPPHGCGQQEGCQGGSAVLLGRGFPRCWPGCAGTATPLGSPGRAGRRGGRRPAATRTSRTRRRSRRRTAAPGR